MSQVILEMQEYIGMSDRDHQSKHESSPTRVNEAANANSASQTGEQGSPLGYAFGSGLNRRQHAVLRMQQRVGNAAVLRMLATRSDSSRRMVRRDDDPGAQDADGTPTAVDYDPRSWPTALTTTKRGRGQHITKVPGKAELNVPDMPEIQLDETQQAIVEAIARNRADLPAALDKIALKSYKGQDNAGYYYNGADSKGIGASGGGAGGSKRQQVLDAVRAEISREGGSSAVNTYDDAIVTLGKGFTRSILAKVMQSFFQKDAEAKNLFLDIGVTWENNTARVVNTDTGGIEEGDDALQLLRLEPEILSRFVTMAESQEHGPTLAAVQDQTIMGIAGQVPQSVIDGWSDMMAIRLVAHCIHGRSAKGWADYAGTGGDVKAIMRIFLPLMGKVDADHGGALYLTPEQTTITFSMALGKAKEALDSKSPKTFPSPIPEGSLSGHAVFDAGSNQYYDMTL